MIEKRILTSLLAMYLILGSWKGYVALFNNGSNEPRQIFPTRIDTLPEADQIALTKGIIVRNQRDLDQLLEDLLS